MMGSVEKRLHTKLEQRQFNNYLRKLPHQHQLIDFCSNDYLGLARRRELHQRIEERQKKDATIGSTGSRLLTGNSPFAEDLEKFLADLFGGERALIFNSGYTANLALLSAIPQKGDAIIMDELSHASIREGTRLSLAERLIFKHNDIDDLRDKLKSSHGEKFVVVESVYSMDGDKAPIQELTTLCRQHNANLMIDEAHSTGVFGQKGNGLVCELGLEKEFLARVYTFGKGMGAHGACVVASHTLIDYLINYASPFIFTTALPHHSLASIWEAFHFLEENPDLQEDIKSKVSLFRSEISETLTRSEVFLSSETSIQAMIVPGNARAKSASQDLMEKGFDVRPILYPSVAKGKERLRISLHSFNKDSEIKDLVRAIGQL